MCARGTLDPGDLLFIYDPHYRDAISIVPLFLPIVSASISRIRDAFRSPPVSGDVERRDAVSRGHVGDYN